MPSGSDNAADDEHPLPAPAIRHVAESTTHPPHGLPPTFTVRIRLVQVPLAMFVQLRGPACRCSHRSRTHAAASRAGSARSRPGTPARRSRPHAAGSGGQHHVDGALAAPAELGREALARATTAGRAASRWPHRDRCPHSRSASQKRFQSTYTRHYRRHAGQPRLAPAWGVSRCAARRRCRVVVAGAENVTPPWSPPFGRCDGILFRSSCPRLMVRLRVDRRGCLVVLFRLAYLGVTNALAMLECVHCVVADPSALVVVAGCAAGEPQALSAEGRCSPPQRRGGRSRPLSLRRSVSQAASATTHPCRRMPGARAVENLGETSQQRRTRVSET